ncbi:general odorant-binding protein 19d-like [Topomyia yanbarensis]|uniref:general odorant-binding protein 19d-like n=1 Tax=Topomyia yanbarensis TaxID=2498891 RepID=UPI00273A91B4|nr:general odorant-binding protein 19d-like [Topomyia yanbarensis]
MRNLYIIAVCTVLVLTSCKAEQTDEEMKERGKEMIRGLAQDCKASEGATDADVEDLVEDKMPETQVQKCFHSCMQQQFGISDGKQFSKKGFVQISAMMFKKDEEKLNVAKEVAEECDGTANDDRCELAVDIMTCIRSGLEKRGITKD